MAWQHFRTSASYHHLGARLACIIFIVSSIVDMCKSPITVSIKLKENWWSKVHWTLVEGHWDLRKTIIHAPWVLPIVIIDENQRILRMRDIGGFFMHKKTHKVWVLRLWNNLNASKSLFWFPSLFQYLSSNFRNVAYSSSWYTLHRCLHMLFHPLYIYHWRALDDWCPHEFFFEGRFTSTHEWGASWIL